MIFKHPRKTKIYKTNSIFITKLLCGRTERLSRFYSNEEVTARAEAISSTGKWITTKLLKLCII